jgi:hypothetical protein
MSEKREYNTTFVALWAHPKSGSISSMKTDEMSLAKFKEAVAKLEPGGRFIVKTLSAKAREAHRNPDKAPHYYFEFQSKANVDAFEAEQAKRRATESDGGGL